MKTSLRTLIAALPIALAALTAAGPAAARQHSVDIHVQHSRAPVYVADYDDRGWRDDRRDYRREGRRHSCGAQRWNPQVRYAPGELVRRHGEVYVARRVSAHVYNQNSPPEWTPNYWAPARC